MGLSLPVEQLKKNNTDKSEVQPLQQLGWKRLSNICSGFVLRSLTLIHRYVDLIILPSNLHEMMTVCHCLLGVSLASLSDMMMMVMMMMVMMMR